MDACCFRTSSARVFSDRGSSARIKKGGYFIVTTPTPMAKPLLEILSYRLHVISEESIREHQHYYTKKELEALMKSHGCRIEAYKKFQFGMNQLAVGKKE